MASGVSSAFGSTVVFGFLFTLLMAHIEYIGRGVTPSRPTDLFFGPFNGKF